MFPPPCLIELNVFSWIGPCADRYACETQFTYSRNDVDVLRSFQSSAPGSLSLNLRGLSADDVPRFHAAVADMVPKCVTVPVTTKSLSEEFTFSPKKVSLWMDTSNGVWDEGYTRGVCSKTC